MSSPRFSLSSLLFALTFFALAAFCVSLVFRADTYSKPWLGPMVPAGAAFGIGVTALTGKPWLWIPIGLILALVFCVWVTIC